MKGPQGTSDDRPLDAEMILFQARTVALRRMACAVAHDLNNSTATILGNNGFLEDMAAENPAMQRHVQRIERATTMIQGMAERLTTYAATAHPEPEPVAMAPRIENAIQPLRNDHGSITFSSDVAPDCPPVLASTESVDRLLAALLANAIEAIDDSLPGSIHVSVSGIWIEACLQPPLSSDGSLTAGPYGVITVSDTGRGIPPENRSQAFDPFFTTKLRGEGLGLAVVLGLVHMYRGALHLTSTVGRGTTITLYLPAAPGA